MDENCKILATFLTNSFFESFFQFANKNFLCENQKIKLSIFLSLKSDKQKTILNQFFFLLKQCHL